MTYKYSLMTIKLMPPGIFVSGSGVIPSSDRLTESLRRPFRGARLIGIQYRIREPGIAFTPLFIERAELFSLSSAVSARSRGRFKVLWPTSFSISLSRKTQKPEALITADRKSVV